MLESVVLLGRHLLAKESDGVDATAGAMAHLLDELPSPGKAIEGIAALEVETALESLGFNLRDIRRELSLLPADANSMSSEQLIKEIIKRLYQKTK